MKTEAKAQMGRMRPRYYFLIVLALAVVVGLLAYRLGSIMPGISPSENSVYSLGLGWHGLYHQPLNLPINLLRSIDFKFFSPVSQAMLRLPNVILGGLTIVAFFVLLWLWYGTRTAIFGSIMFASAAWTLHVSRLATYNVEYLFAVTVFFLTTAVLQKHLDSQYSYTAINLVWGLLLFVPGMVWFILLAIWRQHKELQYGKRQQVGIVAISSYWLSAVLWAPLLIIDFIRSSNNLILWLGLPVKLKAPLTLFKEFIGVGVHIFFRGPQYPDLWLGKAPVLDLFSLVVCVIGIYFYVTHLKAGRSRLLFAGFIIGAVLIALGGAVDLSAVMPIVYLWIAAGVAYLLQQWLQVFPINPIARGLGYGLIVLAVALSCLYNLRAYYVAWPNNPTSQAVFEVRR